MAITRAQQAKQMLQDGGMLVKPSTDGKRPGYRSAKFQSARERARGPQSTFSAEIEDETTPQDRQEVQRERESLRYVPTGGEQKDQSEIVKRQKKNYEQQFYDKGQVPPLGSRPTSLRTKIDQRNKQKRLNYINNLIDARRQKILGGLEIAGIKGVTEENFDELYNKGMLNIPSVADLVEQGFYSKDGRFATEGAIPDFPGMTPPGFLGVTTDILGGPLTTDRIDQLLQENIDLENLKTTEGLEGTTFNELMETYEPNRFKLENPEPGGRDDTPMDPCKGPNPPAYCNIDPPSDPNDPSTPSTGVFAGIAPRFAGSIFDFDALRAGAMDGGIMSNRVMGGMADGNIDESGRQMYFLGKLVKKATRAVKKIAKSPFGKAALIGLGAGMAGFGPAKGLFASGKGLGFKKFLTDSIMGKAIGVDSPGGGGGIIRSGGLLNFIKNNPYKSIFAGSTLLGLMGDKDDDGFDINEYYRTAGLGGQEGIDAIRRGRNLAAAFDGSTYNYEDYAVGGRAGYQEGGDAEPVAKKTMPLLDMDGMEKDYREDGGFVPIGRMERADDVPARLSKNEFVFTADAVRNAGDGDIDKGAEVMYNMMKNLESGGDVSEESQGLEGAREMFKTSQRLGEVL